MQAILAVDIAWGFGMYGGLPWGQDPSVRFERSADLKRLYALCEGNVCLVGARTLANTPILSKRIRRLIVAGPEEAKLYGEGYPDSVVIGGLHTFRMCWPWVTKVHLTIFRSQWPADVMFDPSLFDGFTRAASDEYEKVVFETWERKNYD